MVVKNSVFLVNAYPACQQLAKESPKDAAKNVYNFFFYALGDYTPFSQSGRLATRIKANCLHIDVHYGKFGWSGSVARMDNRPMAGSGDGGSEQEKNHYVVPVDGDHGPAKKVCQPQAGSCSVQ